jgi:hypothetical protein
MKENVIIKNQNRVWNIIKADGTTAGTSKNLKIAVQNCTDSNYIITNMSDVIDNLYRSDSIFNMF